MLKSIALSTALIAGVGATAGAAVNTAIMLDEERLAHIEERNVIQTPIAGIENKYWFNYRTNVVETKKELASDLARATDTEDLRDAWDEYRVELADGRSTYVQKMAKRGYYYPTVTVEG